MTAKDILRRIIDPRPRLEGLYPQTGEGPTGSTPTGARGRLRFRHVVTNVPFLIGSIIVLGLFLLAVFGPIWAPRNPYIAGEHIVPHFDSTLQEFVRPPLSPLAGIPPGHRPMGQ
jgi:hypothetical protein